MKRPYYAEMVAGTLDIGGLDIDQTEAAIATAMYIGHDCRELINHLLELRSEDDFKYGYDRSTTQVIVQALVSHNYMECIDDDPRLGLLERRKKLAFLCSGSPASCRHRRDVGAIARFMHASSYDRHLAGLIFEYV